VQSAFCITRQHRVATVSICELNKEKDWFSKQVQWLGGRFSNATPA
jgi:hypothetical protein